ncbi:hypothetical protein Mapa_017303 [Marchantia paleacea]|nr:hypothetical protein Mapa_017303 [Marchantia paleacea]
MRGGRAAMALCLAAGGLSGVLADAAEAAIAASSSSMLTLQNVLFGLLAATVGLILAMNLKGKKLKLPPGPPGVPIFGNWLQIGDDLNHRNLAELAKKYGDVCMLKMGQRNYVIVSSPEVAKEVLHTQGVEFGSRTRNVVFDIFTGNGQDMVFTVYGEHWRRMRRIMTVPFFTSKVVMQSRFAWEDEINHVIKDLTASKEASTTGVIIRRRLQLMMYNVMYRMMFDRRFETVDDPLFIKLKAVNGERSRLAQSFEYNYGDFIPILRPFLRKYLAYCQELKDKRLALFKEYFIEERKKILSTRGSGIGEKAAIDYIFESEQKGEINEDNVLYIVENINVAAIETTLWSIEWGVAELCNNPDIFKKLRNELDSTLGRGNLVSEPDLPQLPYLGSVVKEVMRLHMAIPLLVPHMNLHQAKLAGYDIPAESKILVNAWWIANNPEHWDEPEKFNPERFMDGKIESSGNDFRFLPFGSGRRSCPGIIIAIPLLSLVLGRLVQSFDLYPPPGVDKIDMTEKGGQFSLFIKTHYNVVVKPRAD